MTEQEQKAKVDAAVEVLLPVIRPIVAQIESEVPVTKNRYDKYGYAISTLSKGNRNMAVIICLAMQKAGGNNDGIVNGFKNFI